MDKKSGFQINTQSIEFYEQHVVPNLFEPFAKALIESINLQNASCVLDAACGTGIVLRKVHEAVQGNITLIGIDINEDMINAAKSLSPKAGNKILWHTKSVAETGFDNNFFDTILCQQGIQYFPDQTKALNEFYRIMQKNGRLLMTVWTQHSPLTLALTEALNLYVSEEAARKMNAQRQPPPIEDLINTMNKLGFQKISVKTQALDLVLPTVKEYVPYHLKSLPVAKLYNQLKPEERETFLSEIERKLQAYTNGCNLIIPDSVYRIVGYK